MNKLSLILLTSLATTGAYAQGTGGGITTSTDPARAAAVEKHAQDLQAQQSKDAGAKPAKATPHASTQKTTGKTSSTHKSTAHKSTSHMHRTRSRRRSLGNRGCLLDPPRPDEITTGASAPVLGFSPASISNARAALRDAGLLERDGLPVVPELFWALADVWKPDRAWLVQKPKPGDTHTNVDDLDEPGWCLTGTAAAVEWGAPVVAADPILDLYVPGPVMVTIARREYNTAAPGPRRQLPPFPLRRPPSSPAPPPAVRKGRWPLAHPLAVALDLAQDRSGREILKTGRPPRSSRVW